MVGNPSSPMRSPGNYRPHGQRHGPAPSRPSAGGAPNPAAGGGTGGFVRKQQNPPRNRPSGHANGGRGETAPRPGRSGTGAPDASSTGTGLSSESGNSLRSETGRRLGRSGTGTQGSCRAKPGHLSKSGKRRRVDAAPRPGQDEQGTPPPRRTGPGLLSESGKRRRESSDPMKRKPDAAARAGGRAAAKPARHARPASRPSIRPKAAKDDRGPAGRTGRPAFAATGRSAEPNLLSGNRLSRRGAGKAAPGRPSRATGRHAA